MNISDANYNINNASANVNLSKPQGNTLGGVAKILQIAEGQLFNGIVADINNNDVKIMLNNNQTLFAHMSENVNINIGENITFMVKENDGANVTISPVANNEGAMKDGAIFKALELNNISPTEKNYNIADALIKNNMPLDKTSMQRIMQQSYKFPDASIETLVSMNKLGIEVNETNISQFEDYMSNTHQLSDDISKLTESIFDYAKEGMEMYAENSDISLEEAFVIQDKLLTVISDETDFGKDTSDYMPDKLIKDFVSLLNESGFSDENIKQLVSESKSGVDFLDKLATLIKDSADIDKGTVLKLLGSDTYKEIFKEVIKDKFSLNPEKMNNPEEIDELYKSMYEKTDKLIKTFSDTGSKAGQQMGEQAKGMQERLNFIQNLNNMYVYAQIPLRLSEQMANSELFVYMNKKSLKTNKDEVSAMLHLDMDNLGHTDVHVSLSNNIIHTKFYVEDAISARIIDEHIQMLENAVNNSGYSLVNETITKDLALPVNENMVTKNVTGHDIEKSVKRYSFDIRA